MKLLGAVTLCLLALVAVAGCEDDWPFDDEMSLSENLPDEFGTSGAAWVEELELVVTVSDKGKIAFVDLDGELIFLRNYNNKAFDLEGVSVGPVAGYVYVAVEHPPTLIEVDVTSGLMLRNWEIDMPTTAEDGIESLTYVPVTDKSGYFYVGNQNDGLIYVVPFYFGVMNTEHFNGTLLYPARTLELVEGRTDLGGLNWDPQHGKLWLLYDGDDPVAYSFTNSTPITDHAGSNVGNWVLKDSYEVPGKKQEGITVAGSDGAYMVVASDRDSHDDQLVRYDY